LSSAMAGAAPTTPGGLSHVRFDGVGEIQQKGRGATASSVLSSGARSDDPAFIKRFHPAVRHAVKKGWIRHLGPYDVGAHIAPLSFPNT